MINGRTWAILVFSGLMSACSWFSGRESEDKLLASYEGHELYFSDLPEDVIKRLQSTDSLSVLKLYVNNWINQKVLLEKAEDNLGDEISGLEKKVSDYRDNLVIYEYQRAYMEEQLDTLVTNEQIQAYYDKNQKNFELKRNMLRMRYVKFPKGTPDLNKARNWFRSNDESDRYKLLEFCEEHAENTFFDEDSWLAIEDLYKEIPLKDYPESALLAEKKLLELNDENYTYWIYIISYRAQNSVSPLELERETIRNIIINQRKLNMLKDLEKNLLEEARSNKKIQWYID